MSYVIANRQGSVLELATGDSHPADGVLMQGDNATAFRTPEDASEAIWRTITWMILLQTINRIGADATNVRPNTARPMKAVAVDNAGNSVSSDRMKHRLDSLA